MDSSSDSTCPVRGIYFATHFGDWYDNAPIENVSVQFRPVAGENGWYSYRFVPTWVTIEVSLDGRVFTTAVHGSRDVPLQDQMYKQWFYRYPVHDEGHYVKLSFGPSQETSIAFTGCVQLTEIRIHAEQ